MRQVFVLNDTAITEIYTLSLHDALPISTVGSVIPTEGAIIPAAVGVDIGCGMMAVRTQFDAADLAGKDLSVLHGQISRSIPLSAGKYNKKLRFTAEPRVEELRALPGADQANGVVGNWPLQLGSLGS